MTWRLTADAERDLDAITTHGARTFGLASALEYYDELIELFYELAAHPHINPERNAKRHSVRLHRHKGHHVLYAIEDADVLILRILHGSADWIDHL